jgi:hypothetical protein
VNQWLGRCVLYCVVSSLDNITHIVHNSNAIWTVHQNFCHNIIKLVVHNGPLKTDDAARPSPTLKCGGVKNSAINDVTLNLQILRTSDL